MQRFPNPLGVDLAVCSGESNVLAGAFSYIDPQVGALQVPSGFCTDFASVGALKWIAWVLLLAALPVGYFFEPAGAVLHVLGFLALVLYAHVVGKGNAAAVVHDWLYTYPNNQATTRAAADRVLRNALVSSGYPREIAWIFWIGVRLGGHWHYHK